MTQITSYRLVSYEGAEGDYSTLTWENRDKIREATDGLKAANETLHRLCDDAAWLMIIDRKHPGEGYRTKLIAKLAEISRHFGGLGSRSQAAAVAKLLGGWNVHTGASKTWKNIIPVRSLMDVK